MLSYWGPGPPGTMPLAAVDHNIPLLHPEQTAVICHPGGKPHNGHLVATQLCILLVFRSWTTTAKRLLATGDVLCISTTLKQMPYWQNGHQGTAASDTDAAQDLANFLFINAPARFGSSAPKAAPTTVNKLVWRSTLPVNRFAGDKAATNPCVIVQHHLKAPVLNPRNC